MREIKFRGWDEKNKEMVYNINLLFSNHLNECFEEYEECGLKIMQYTGLDDKNGVKIFEGDVVIDRYDKKGYVVFLQQEMGYSIVYEDHDSRIGHRSRGSLYDRDCGLEIIGNIHDNPELVGVRE